MADCVTTVLTKRSNAPLTLPHFPMPLWLILKMYVGDRESLETNVSSVLNDTLIQKLHDGEIT